MPVSIVSVLQLAYAPVDANEVLPELPAEMDDMATGYTNWG